MECDSDHELLIAKFRLKLKKLGKSTRPFSNDLNQIPYYYTVEVTNRFKRLELTECKEVWKEVHSFIGGGDQNHPQEEMQKDKMVL